MSRYLETAAQIKPLVQQVLDHVPEDSGAHPVVAELIARIVNLAVKACPRGVQHTVRLNIVRAAVQGLGLVKVGMEDRQDEKTGRTYHALVTQRIVDGHPIKPTEEAIDRADVGDVTD